MNERGGPRDSGLGSADQALRDVISAASGQRNDDVEFSVSIEGIPGIGLFVRSVRLHEELNDLSGCDIDLLFSGPALDPSELLGKNVELSIARREQRRAYRGLIRYASRRQLVEGTELQLNVVPAAWLLTRRVESRIYQDKTVPQIVESIVQEHLGARQRTLESKLSQEYPTYEYVVQYQESCWAFLSRLCEQEGIFFFFEHGSPSAAHEVLVLADSSSNLQRVREASGGVVPFLENPDQTPDHEGVSYVIHREEYGISDVVVSDYDWTNPRLDVRGEQTGRGSGSPALEVYDHTDAVQFHEYANRQYGENTATTQARLRAQLLDAVRQRWEMTSTVVTMQPGRVFDLANAADPSHTQRYLVVGVHAQGASERATGHWRNSIEVVPTSMPYRPRRTTRKPAVVGPETATVVGPSGEEIHTDEHGRVKVQFHWDRHGQRDEHSTCWLRVTQGWAGPGWGFFFLPRIGMEVVVSFLGGNPDRPFVTGCLYNGANTPPYALPENKTRSTVKSNSSLGGNGYNELRFEDKQGSEEVWIHAQKDMNEVVENDHTTHVKHDRTDTVDNDHDETIGNDQTNSVRHHRNSTVGRETITVRANRTVSVGGAESLTTRGTRTETVSREYMTTVNQENRTIRVLDGVYDLVQNKGTVNKIVLDELGATMASTVLVDCKAASLEADKAQLKLHIDGLAELISWETNVHVEAKTQIKLSVGENSSITITESQIEIKAPTINVRGQGLVDIKADMIKLNCD